MDFVTSCPIRCCRLNPSSTQVDGNLGIHAVIPKSLVKTK